MAGNMGLIAKKYFPNATHVTDRFQVQKLATKTLQEIRIKYRWQAIDFDKLAKWHEKVSQSSFRSFHTISRTIINHY
jgi:transposase